MLLRLTCRAYAKIDTAFANDDDLIGRRGLPWIGRLKGRERIYGAKQQPKHDRYRSWIVCFHIETLGGRSRRFHGAVDGFCAATEEVNAAPPFGRVRGASRTRLGENPDQQHANASDNYLKCDAEKWCVHVAIANSAFFGDRLRRSPVEDGDAMREAPNRFKLPCEKRR